VLARADRARSALFTRWDEVPSRDTANRGGDPIRGEQRLVAGRVVLPLRATFQHRRPRFRRTQRVGCPPVEVGEHRARVVVRELDTGSDTNHARTVSNHVPGNLPDSVPDHLPDAGFLGFRTTFARSAPSIRTSLKLPIVGYGLRIDGFRAFEALVRREQSLSRRPYAAYCFLLALNSDEAQTEFLETYARDIDAITGEGVAFIVLLDSVSLRGEFHANPQWGAQPQPRPPLVGIDNQATYEIFERVATRSSTDHGWTSAWQISGSSSVDFARCCGVELTELPCLVVFDGADLADNALFDRDRGLVVSLTGSANDYEVIRSACSDFYRDERDSEFLQLVRLWDSLMAETRRQHSMLDDWQRRQPAVPNRVGWGQDPRAYERTVRQLPESPTFRIPSDDVWHGLRRLDAEIAGLRRFIRSLDGWKAMSFSARSEAFANEGSEIREAANDLDLRYSMPAAMARLQALEWEKRNAMADILRPIDSVLQLERERTAADATARHIAERDQIRVQLAQVIRQRKEVASRILDVDRPGLTSRMERAVRSDRRRARRLRLSASAAASSDWLRALLEAMTSVASRLP
jgi:hypothetical protein